MVDLLVQAGGTVGPCAVYCAVLCCAAGMSHALLVCTRLDYISCTELEEGYGCTAQD